MKLTIAYYLCQDYDNLEASLNSLLSQHTKEMEIIFIFDFSIQQVDEIFSKFNTNASNIKIVRFQENLGISYASNFAIKLAQGEYIYFAEQKVNFKNNFFDTFSEWISNDKKYDFLSFDKKISLSLKDINANTEYDKKNADLNFGFIVNSKLSIKHKIFNTIFLRQNNIKFVLYKNFHSLFVFDVIENASHWLVSNNFLIDWYESKNKSFEYSLYDILNSSSVLNSKLNELNIFDDKRKAYEIWIAILVLYEFLKKMFFSYKSEKKILLKALTNANYLINLLCPDYKENKFLDLLLNKKLKNFIKNFKPSIEYVKKSLF